MCPGRGFGWLATHDHSEDSIKDEFVWSTLVTFLPFMRIFGFWIYYWVRYGAKKGKKRDKKGVKEPLINKKD